MHHTTTIGTHSQSIRIDNQSVTAKARGVGFPSHRLHQFTNPPIDENGKLDSPCDIAPVYIPQTEGYVEIWRGASLVKCRRPPTHSLRVGADRCGGKRGRVRGFSKSSRRRMLQRISKVRNQVAPIFVTLTYPDEFPFDSAEWKRHLHNFFKRLFRWCRMAGAFWKMEPQKRGAPHFHLLIWGVNQFAFDAWCHKVWYEVVGSGDKKHLRRGAKVERLRSWRGAKSYAAKYLGKMQADSEIEGWNYPGRWWGVFNEKAIPWGECIRFAVPRKEAILIIRCMRRLLRIKGLDLASLTILCNSADWWEDNLTRLLYG